MKITRRSIHASEEVAEKKEVQAAETVEASDAIEAASTEDMLAAFQGKLAEFGIESATDVCDTDSEEEVIEGYGPEVAEEVESCDAVMSSDEEVCGGEEICDRCVEIYDEDYNEKYEDVGGGFDADGIITLADAKDYWNRENDNDPTLLEYDNFEDWWIDTRDNYLEEIYE